MRRHLKIAFMTLALAAAMPLAIPARAASTAPTAAAEVISVADTKAIRAVVQAQLDAFAADDAKRAFSLAAPKIREMFGDADTFLSMVRSGYPVVYRPASIAFLVPQRIEGEVIQSVRMTDGRGAFWLATYQLQRQPDKSWRIAGCQVTEIEGRVT